MTTPGRFVRSHVIGNCTSVSYVFVSNSCSELPAQEKVPLASVSVFDGGKWFGRYFMWLVGLCQLVRSLSLCVCVCVYMCVSVSVAQPWV